MNSENNLNDFSDGSLDKVTGGKSVNVNEVLTQITIPHGHPDAPAVVGSDYRDADMAREMPEYGSAKV